MCHPRVSTQRLRQHDLAALQRPRIELSEPGHPRPVLRAAGELDGAVAPELAALLDLACEPPIEALLLDFADVELLDARIIGLIESTRQRLEASGAALRVVASGQPLRLLRLTGLAPRLGAWAAPSSSSSSPTTTSAPTGLGSIR